MNQLAKEAFDRVVNIAYEKSREQGNPPDEAMRMAINEGKQLIERIVDLPDNSLIKQWSTEWWSRVPIRLTKPSMLVNVPKTDWYPSKSKTNMFFWMRYKEYLLNCKKWSPNAVEDIDSTTDNILSQLGDPSSANSFDKRGLVLGYVQSGKTANYTGLINKAFDCGYKLIIVLAGIHNDLRAQTQLRLEEEVVGRRTLNDQVIGVAAVRKNDQDHIINTWTSVEEDFNINTSKLNINLANPSLLVVKKNKTVLEALKNTLTEFFHVVDSSLLHSLPVLIIDDEADQASVNTSRANRDEDPKAINRLIRELLSIFHKKCYVGYTATPFANLLIDVNANHQSSGKDLYPGDFVVGLPKPEYYCGPEEFFNVYEDESYNRPSLIRHLGSEDIQSLEPIKKAKDADKFEEVPPKMLEAIYAFLLAVSIRNLRGQRKKHNSMLIHTSRYKVVQSVIKKEIESTFEYVRNQILFNEEGKIVSEIRSLYETDFVPTSKDWSDSIPIFEWDDVYNEMRELVENIFVLEINGDSKDALDYHNYVDKGMNVIVVGGDKLSRGLTLEGLSVSYYLRNTLMYDTLMQMGRWFGYKTDYIDLCRIYTSERIASNFEHLAIAMKELRDEFDRLAKLNKTPQEFAIKMLSHPSMTLTNHLKMQHAIQSHTVYEGTLQQTRLFSTTTNFYEKNMMAVVEFLNDISVFGFEQFSDKRSGSTYHLARDIKVEHIIKLLDSYETHQDAPKANSKRLNDYIKLAVMENELINWTVAVFEGPKRSEEFPVNLGPIHIKRPVKRGMKLKSVSEDVGKIDLGAIVSPGQEFLDLEIKDENIINDKQSMRARRSEKNGFLMIYPLSPLVPVFKGLGVTFSEDLVPIAIAISFPASNILGRSDSKVYVMNKTVLQNIQVEVGR